MACLNVGASLGGKEMFGGVVARLAVCMCTCKCMRACGWPTVAVVAVAWPRERFVLGHGPHQKGQGGGVGTRARCAWPARLDRLELPQGYVRVCGCEEREEERRKKKEHRVRRRCQHYSFLLAEE